MGLSGFVGFTLVRPGIFLGSSGVVGFTRVRPWGRWFHPGSLYSPGFALGVVAFIRGRWAHSRSRWVLVCSSVVVGLNQFTLVVVVFIWRRWVHSGSNWGSLRSSGVAGFTLGAGVFIRWVHSDSLWGRWIHTASLGSLGFELGVVEVVGFTLVRPEGHWVHPGSLGSHTGAPWRSLRVTRVCPGSRWGHTGSLGLLGFAMAVVGFIRVRPGSRSLGFVLGVVGFIRCRWVHSVSHWGHWVHPVSLGSHRIALGVLRFFRSRWGSSFGSFSSSGVCLANLSSPWVSLASLGFALGVVGFTRVRPGGRWVHPGTRVRPGVRWAHSGSP